jgi:hypothetical protein
MNKEIENFANEHTIARDIKVTVLHGFLGFSPKNCETFKYEDAEYLKRLIDGATAYLMWKRRKNGLRKSVTGRRANKHKDK